MVVIAFSMDALVILFVSIQQNDYIGLRWFYVFLFEVSFFFLVAVLLSYAYLI